MKWYAKVLKKYLEFGGRARRTEFWMFHLMDKIIILILAIFAAFLYESSENVFFIGIVIFYSLATFIPSISVAVRRLHDTNKSGAFYFVYFIPFIGWIWFLVLMVTEGDKGENQYGPDSKVDQGLPPLEPDEMPSSESKKNENKDDLWGEIDGIDNKDPDSDA